MVMWGLAAGTLAPHGEAHSPGERPPPAFTHGCGCGPFKHKAELMEGKKRENGVGGGGGRERVCS